jgi:Trypsin-co-occurring domain 1
VRQLVEFDVEGGSSVLVEMDEEDPGFERVGRSDRAAAKAAEALGAAIDAVLPAARQMVEKAQTIGPHTSEVEVQFGVRFTATAGAAAIASASGEGHFQVRVLCRTSLIPTSRLVVWIMRSDGRPGSGGRRRTSGLALRGLRS